MKARAVVHTYEEVYPTDGDDEYPEIDHGFVGTGGWDYAVPNMDLSTDDGKVAYDSARADATLRFDFEEDAEEGETESEAAVRWLSHQLQRGCFSEPSSCPSFGEGDWFSSGPDQDFRTGVSRTESLHPEGFTTEEIRAAYARAFKQ